MYKSIAIFSLFLLASWLGVRGAIPLPQAAPIHAVVINQDSIRRASELECLSRVMFEEARGEGERGLLAVATVTMNRVKSRSYPNTVCRVVYQKSSLGCQFSWSCDLAHPKNRDIPAAIRRLAVRVLDQNVRLQTVSNAVFFHNFTVQPKWSMVYTPVDTIGNHIFYSFKPRVGVT